MHHASKKTVRVKPKGGAPEPAKGDSLAKFLLVHGAAHGAWCWEKLVAQLKARGHQAVAIDLPGSGADRTPLNEVTLDSYEQAVVRALDELGPDTVLVGHSMGGAAISAAAEERPRLLKRLVYLCAMLPRDGLALSDLRTISMNDQRAQIFQLAEDGVSMKADPVVGARIFYSDCSPADIAFASERLTPQVTIVSRTPLRLTPENYGRVSRAYILCTEDKAIPAELQREMIEAAPCDIVVERPWSHSPFLSAPEGLADVLEQIAEGGASHG